MWCLWAVIGAALCACAQAKLNPTDLGNVILVGQKGILPRPYPPHKNDTQAAATARVSLERYRPYFTTGLGDLPKLDPFYQKPISIDIKREDFGFNVALSNIQVDGAQQFKLHALNILLATHSTDLEMAFEELMLSFNYHVRLHSDEADTQFSGHANITLKKVAAHVAFNFHRKQIKGSNHFEVDALKLNLAVDDVQYDLMNHLRSRRSVPASRLTRMLFEDVKKEIALAAVDAMIEDLDDVFKHYTIEQIEHWLIPTPI